VFERGLVTGLSRSAFGCKYTTAAIHPQKISMLMSQCNVHSVIMNTDTMEGRNVNYNFQFSSWLKASRNTKRTF